MPMFTRQDLDRFFYNKGFEPLDTDLKDFINYRKIVPYGEGHAGIFSVCIDPNVYEEYSKASDVYDATIQAMIYGE